MPRSYFITMGCIQALWLVWVVIWVVAAGFAKRAVYRQSLGRRLLFVALIAACMVATRHMPGVFAWFIFPNPFTEAAGVGLLAAGLGWAVWARAHLAGNWSGFVTIKENHELIQSGPYRVTRHPIYTGVLLGILGTMLALLPTPGGAAALGIATMAFVFKLREEEKVMGAHFGETYGAYKKRVRARLVPGVI